MAVLPKLPKSNIKNLDELLTPEEADQLKADLAEIARCRIRAIIAARDIPMA